uniref:Uncharacterized protein n=1 Tax=Oryza sativa subsp. japonica TaxID=39947 RepID=Q6YTE1_ORYSJ|nr:hypothetical protein [Oryza sativa Japonica Group]BAD17796.1 hypothetical protein [Oryza sativa Japonica Group]
MAHGGCTPYGSDLRGVLHELVAWAGGSVGWQAEQAHARSSEQASLACAWRQAVQAQPVHAARMLDWLASRDGQ